MFRAEYDEIGNMLAIRYPDWTSHVREYDNENRITKVTNDHPLGEPIYITYTYTYDAVSNFTSMMKDPAIPYQFGPNTYEYDALHRLTYDQAAGRRYEYDSVGNKTRDIITSNGYSVSYYYKKIGTATIY